jgi:RNA polymerase sigma factor for flagellar operon FliA
MRTKTKRVEQTRHELEASLGRHATRAEIAQAAQMTAQAVEDAEGMAHSSSAGAHASLAELDLPDQSAQSPEDDVAHTESIARVRVALDALPPRHRRILELHYGEQLTLREIGNLIGVTEARISQLMANAVQRLKDTCAAPE